MEGREEGREEKEEEDREKTEKCGKKSFHHNGKVVKIKGLKD